MKTVLVTGAIGSGKSELCRFLGSQGKRVYDCDSRCKALYEEVPGLKQEVEKLLGVPFCNIGIIFSDNQKREALESLVYPILVEDFLKWRAAGDGDCFIESALAALRKEFDGLYDEIWLVRAPLEIRCARNPKAMQRDALQDFSGITPTIIIDNDSTLEKLYKQIQHYI